MGRHPHHTRVPTAEGYAFPFSVDAGEAVQLHGTARGGPVSIEVARIGHQRQPMWRADGVAVADHPVPPDAAARGCDWPVMVEVPTGPAWPSGYYEVLLTADDGDTSEAFFVIRPSRQTPSQLLLILATNTWNAYNQWGGSCLYSGATELSFERPLERGYLVRSVEPDGFDGRVASVEPKPDPSHQRLIDYQARHGYPLWTASSGWFNWERRFVRWAERHGYKVDVATDTDLHRHPGLLDDGQLLVTVGHSEYWSAAMRDRVDEAVETGRNWAIFSGNTCFWQVRMSPDCRTMTCYKGSARTADPMAGTEDTAQLTSAWSDPLIGRPENHTIGLSFTRGGYYRMGDAVPAGSGGYTIQDPTHWAFEGTGLRYGDELGQESFVVGYEVDGCDMQWVDGRLVPTGTDGTPDSFQIAATAPARLISITDEVCEAPPPLWADTSPPGDLEATAMMLYGDRSAESVAKLASGHCVMGSFRKGGGTVFNAGSTDWAYGLDNNEKIQRVTANVIDHLSG